MYQNIDINSTVAPFLNALADSGFATKEDLYPFVDEFRDTKITDILFNVGGQYSAVKSKYWDSYKEKYEQTEENGFPVDYKQMHRGSYIVNEVYGLEPFGIWIERCKEIGIRPWISFRMNDCHDPKEKTSGLRSSFFYYAREKGMMNGEQYGHYQNSFNYKFLEVREKMLDYITEQLGNFDVCGIELDFMRDLVCFDYIEKDKDICVPVMNEFMRSVKKRVTAREKEVGHKIRIAVRLTRDLAKSLRFGFDARTWAQEGLVDVVIPSPRFHGSDSAIPVKEWKDALPGIEVLACIEARISTDYIGAHNGIADITAEIARGHAAAYLSAGADGIYTFNLFGQRLAYNSDLPARDKEVQQTLGTYEEITSLPLRFVIVDEDNDIVPAGFERWQQLPIIPDAEGKSVIFHTGKLPEDKKKTLIIGFTQGTPHDVTVKINEEVIVGFVPIDTPKPESAMVKDTRCYAAAVTLRDEIQNITITAENTENVITWLEIDVR